MATRNEYTDAGFVAVDERPEGARPPPDPAYTAAGFVEESQGPSVLESLGRGALEGATFGFEDELGLASREAQARSRAANPWSHFAGEVGGGLIPMAAAALLPTGVTQAAAGARAASLGARGLGMLRAALVPGEMNTLGQAALQGAKLGTTYGALSGAGHAEPTANATSVEAAGSRALGALTGAGVGAIGGTGLGVGGLLASRAIGAAINRLSPNMAQVLEAATAPESQGVRDVMRQLGYDNYTMADIEALRTAIRDPSQAHRFANLNMIEALEARQPPQPVIPQPTRQDWQSSLTNAVAPEAAELQQAVRVSPNLRDWAQDMANTGGAGRHEAVEQFAQRRAEMPGRIQADVDHFFGTGEPVESTVNRLFGSGNRAADDAAIVAQREAFNTRYERLREAPLILTNDLRPVLNSRAFRAALQDAAESDVLTNPATGGRWRWLQDPAGIPPEQGTPFILSPANILDIHHSLVMQAKPPVTGATSESVQAGKFKTWFSRWVDANLRGHKNLREDYALFKRQMEAAEMGADLPLNTGGDHRALAFFRQTVADRDKADAAVAKAFPRSEQSMAARDRGELRGQPKLQALRNSMRVAEAYDEVVDSFRKAWGGRIAQEINASTNPAGVIQRLLTNEGRRRINMILGEEAGTAFTRYLSGQLIKEQIANAKTPAALNAIVRGHLTQNGQRAIMRELGPEEGRTFIEALFNKVQQAGLSETLFGNSNTAYKMARNKKADALVDAASALQPWNFRPMQLWGALRTIGSSHFAQRRADQGNALLSQQGPENVGAVLDAILARNQLATTGHPYTIGPLSKVIGPAAAVPPAHRNDRRETPPPFLTPYRP